MSERTLAARELCLEGNCLRIFVASAHPNRLVRSPSPFVLI